MEARDVMMISFSGGRTSAYMTDRLLREPVSDQQLVIFANTGKENSQTLEFVHECDKRWGEQVVWLEYDPIQRYRVVTYQTASRNGEPYQAIIQKRNYLPNVVARFCTQELKVRVIKHYMKDLGFKNWINAVGIRFDEPDRWATTCNIAERECWETWLPLVEWRITKPQVLAFWAAQPFDLQLADHMGNCDLCFLKGKKKLAQIIRQYPHLVDWWQRMEQSVGGTFHKEYSYHELANALQCDADITGLTDQDIPCFCNVD